MARNDPIRGVGRAVVLAAALAVSACGGDGPAGPDLPSIAGAWQGQIVVSASSSFGPVVRLHLTGTGSGAPVGGTAELTPAGEVTVSGSYRHPIVVLTLSDGSQEPLRFAGRFIGENSIAGSVTWPGYYDVAHLTIQRDLELPP